MSDFHVIHNGSTFRQNWGSFAEMLKHMTIILLYWTAVDGFVSGLLKYVVGDRVVSVFQTDVPVRLCLYFVLFLIVCVIIWIRKEWENLSAEDDD